MGIYNIFYNRWYKKSCDLAYKTDLEYKRIQDLRVPKDRNTTNRIFLSKDLVLGWPEIKYQADIRKMLTPFPLYLKLLQKIGHIDSPKNMYRKYLKWPSQRIKRGYSELDMWNFHSYLSKVISSGVKELHSVLHGWPGEPLTFEDWQEILLKISGGFEAAVKIDNLDYIDENTHQINKELQQQWMKEFDEGFALFHKYYFHLWD